MTTPITSPTIDVTDSVKVTRSVQAAANQLRNESGRQLRSVWFAESKPGADIAGSNKTPPPWLLDRIAALSRKYSLSNWRCDVRTEEKREEKPAKKSARTIREEWQQLNGALEYRVAAITVKETGRGTAAVSFTINGKSVSLLDLTTQPLLHAKLGREINSHAREVSVVSIRLAVLVLKAVARREHLKMAENGVEIEKWGNRSPLVIRLEELGKEGLRPPTKKMEEAAAKAPRARAPKTTVCEFDIDAF